MRRRAVALVSGGLDSLLALKLVEDQGIEVLPLHFFTPFFGHPDLSFRSRLSERYGIHLFQVIDMTDGFLPLLIQPRHGLGRHLNPCIDCKILLLKKAKKIMEREGALFIVTGEVLGQRPMSQRKEAFKMIEKESHLEGLVLRPLSAQLLSPTIPEREGWVDRKRLEAIQGRGRKRQIELASRCGWNKMPSPAGGCLLTDPSFCPRLSDLLNHSSGIPDKKELELLKVGRHFRLNPKLKLVVGRRGGENRIIEELASEEDLLVIPKGFPGPAGLMIGVWDKGGIGWAASIIARYCGGSGPLTFLYKGKENGEVGAEAVEPEDLGRWLVR